MVRRRTAREKLWSIDKSGAIYSAFAWIQLIATHAKLLRPVMNIACWNRSDSALSQFGNLNELLRTRIESVQYALECIKLHASFAEFARGR
jgi:hypothetical protein